MRVSSAATPPTRGTSATTPPKLESLPAETPRITPIGPNVPQPKMLKKGDGVRIILEE